MTLPLSVVLTLGGRPLSELVAELRRAGVRFNAYAEEMLRAGRVEVASESVPVRVEVHSVLAGLEARDAERNLDDLAGALRALDERRASGDAFAFDVRMRLHGSAGSWFGRRLARLLRECDRSSHAQHCGYH